MSWSAGFISALQTGGAQTWRIRTIQLGTEATYAGEYVATSGVPDGAEDPILSGPPTVQGSSLNIDAWTATIGGMSFTLSGSLATLKQYITRGTCVEVLLAVGGYIERVSVGRVTGVSYRSGRASIDIGDALTLLDCRSVADGDEVPLFYDLPNSSSLTADYTVGDTTVNVASTSTFQWESGATGCIKIGEFFLTYTGKTATTFTGCSVAGAFWTTAADTASGGSVYDVVLMEGHPLTIAMRVLMSTGAGTNGDYDDYPASWGYGITTGVIDVDDIEAERDEKMTVSTGTYVIDVVTTEEQNTPRTWLTGWLSAFGVVPVLRQGSLSFRAFSTQVGKTRATVATYSDADIDHRSGGVSSEWFNASQPTEYGLVEIYAQDVGIGDASEDLATLPGTGTKTYDLQAVLYTNVGAVMEDVHDRLYFAAKRIGEVLTLPISGLGPWQHAVGDAIIFQSTLQGLRFDYSGLGRECWVVQVKPDPMSARVTLVVVSFPPEDAF